MIPDLTNAYGIAALYETTVTQHQHGMSYILATDGTGLLVENDAGGQAWRAFTALPAGVDIAEVAHWSPFTVYTHGGDWYTRSTSSGTWLAAAVGGDARPETVPAQKPDPPLPELS